jgi:hypothetical protein
VLDITRDAALGLASTATFAGGLVAAAVQFP